MCGVKLKSYMKMMASWDRAPHSLLEVDHYCLHPQDSFDLDDGGSTDL